MLNKSLKDRILERVSMIPEAGCWIWEGGLAVNGYGKISVSNKTISVHRASYREFIGEIPEGLQVLHKCDVKSCCNPSHLFSGTPLDNMRDMIAKGRQRYPKIKNYHTRITDTEVFEIRRSALPQRKLAAIYRTTQAHINNIRNHKARRQS